MKYEWREWRDDMGVLWRGLLPIGEPNNYAMTRIASVYCRGSGDYAASYYYPHSTGNKLGSGAVHKTLLGAQRWIERQLEKFWEPPSINNAVLS